MSWETWDFLLDLAVEHVGGTLSTARALREAVSDVVHRYGLGGNWPARDVQAFIDDLVAAVGGASIMTDAAVEAAAAAMPPMGLTLAELRPLARKVLRAAIFAEDRLRTALKESP